MIDDDMLGDNDLFFKLYKHHVDIVAPLAFTRNPPHMPVLYRQEKGFDPVHHQPFSMNHFIRNYPKDTLVNCDAVGFGAVLINMKVFKDMRKPYFMGTTGTGEDVLFCYNARQQAGAKVYMDTATKLTHLGAPLKVDEKYANYYWKNVENKNIEKEYTQFNGKQDSREPRLNTV